MDMNICCKMFMQLCYRNFQVFNQQLSELWQEEPLLRSAPGNAGDLAKVCAVDINR